MPYQPNFLSDLVIIKNLINENKFDGADGAINKFKIYLDQVKALGTYDKVQWNHEWSNVVYSFGHLFKDKSPSSFLKELDDSINATAIVSEKEVLEFIKSEVIFNIWPNERTFAYIIELSNRFNLNAEFVHSLGNLSHIKNNHTETIESLEYFRLASKLNDTDSLFLQDEVNAEMRYVDLLLKENKFEQAKNWAIDLRKIDRFKDYDMPLFGLVKRVEDHTLIQQRIENVTKEAKETISNERMKLIELLGFFSAIMAVLFSTISKQTGDLKSSFKFLIVLGLFLNIFLISMSYVFPKAEKKFTIDLKFVSLCIMIIALILLFIIYN